MCLHVVIATATQTPSLHDHQLTPLSHVCSRIIIVIIVVVVIVCFQCFDAVGWLTEMASGL